MTQARGRSLGVALAALITVTMGACGGKTEPPPPVAPAAQPQPNGRARDQARRDEQAQRSQTDDRARREAEERARREAEAARTRETLAQMVFFDYDMAVIRPDAKRTLDSKVPLLRGNPQIRLTIEGHADERGSTEYNMALGQRRADAIKQYLVDIGLAANRFQTISYGEERPLAMGHDEASWDRNRRGEFRVTAGLTAAR